jgi:hypothetical protein
MSLSEVMEPTVAELQGREAERSSRQNRDHRNTNWQRGRVRAASVLLNTKPKVHPDASGRARWPARKVKTLTRGGPDRESGQGVSRGRSSDETGEQVSRRSEGPKEPRQSGRGSWWDWQAKAHGTRGVTTTVATPDRQERKEPEELGVSQSGGARSEPLRQPRRK